MSMFCPECGCELPDGASFCGTCGVRLTIERLGPYEIRCEISRDDETVLWRAWDSRLEREVAIREKIFAEDTSPEERIELGRAFISDAQKTVRLDRSNETMIYDADFFDDRPAVVMALIDEEETIDMDAAFAPSQPRPVNDPMLLDHTKRMPGAVATAAVPPPPAAAPPQQAFQATPAAQPSNQEKQATWVPFAIVGVAAAVILFIVLMFAMGGASGGSAGGGAPAGTPAYYLSTDGTNVIIYSNTDNPVETTSVLVSDLDDATVSQLAAHMPFATLAEAQNKVKELQVQIAQAKEAKAKEEAEAAKKEAQKAEEEARKAQSTPAPSSNPSTVSTVNAHIKNQKTGTLETVPIRRDADGFVIGDTFTHPYTKAELAALNLSDAELFIARNEMVARTGYNYPDGAIRDYFVQYCPWYNPANPDYELIGVAADNADLIRELENERGSVYKSG